MAVVGIQPVFHYSVEAAFPKGADALLPQTGQPSRACRTRRDRDRGRSWLRHEGQMGVARPGRGAGDAASSSLRRRHMQGSPPPRQSAMEKPVMRLPFMPPGR